MAYHTHTWWYNMSPLSNILKKWVQSSPRPSTASPITPTPLMYLLYVVRPGTCTNRSRSIIIDHDRSSSITNHVCHKTAVPFERP